MNLGDSGPILESELVVLKFRAAKIVDKHDLHRVRELRELRGNEGGMAETLASVSE